MHGRSSTAQRRRALVIGVVAVLMGVFVVPSAAGAAPVVSDPAPALTVAEIRRMVERATGVPAPAGAVVFVVAGTQPHLSPADVDRLLAGRVPAGLTLVRTVTGVPASATVGAVAGGRTVAELTASSAPSPQRGGDCGDCTCNCPGGGGGGGGGGGDGIGTLILIIIILIIL